jgi:hypothetical protein
MPALFTAMVSMAQPETEIAVPELVTADESTAAMGLEPGTAAPLKDAEMAEPPPVEDARAMPAALSGTRSKVKRPRPNNFKGRGNMGVISHLRG